MMWVHRSCLQLYLQSPRKLLLGRDLWCSYSILRLAWTSSPYVVGSFRSVGSRLFTFMIEGGSTAHRPIPSLRLFWVAWRTAVMLMTTFSWFRDSFGGVLWLDPSYDVRSCTAFDQAQRFWLFQGFLFSTTHYDFGFVTSRSEWGLQLPGSLIDR
ncbi:hypothetical protein BDN72DRAFT_432610 [Pluteus cervinus]|uniref:Uncharacterized protein n=1 Tax=Pluteus cervinus TaxID=181527 RepID=A0ACD3B179_9AGAR|nr:hypothetical protein BDN72DRAFT_432610 [Pluteus cervinus]